MSTKTEHRTYTAEEYRQYADAEAQRMLGVSYNEARQQLEAGKLEGTLEETRLKLIEYLMPVEPVAAE